MNLAMTNAISDYIIAKGGTCMHYVSTKSGWRERNLRRFQPSDIDAECIIVLGGDGTLVRAARDMASIGIPLIGNGGECYCKDSPTALPAAASTKPIPPEKLLRSFLLCSILNPLSLIISSVPIFYRRILHYIIGAHIFQQIYGSNHFKTLYMSFNPRK